MADAAITDSVEIWKPAPGWEGLYSVSSHGNVRSEPKTVNILTRWGRKSPRRWPSKNLAQQTLKGRGRYKVVHFKKDGYREAHYVHRLVCRAFHGEPPSPSHQVAHFDGTRDNNHASNLRWATAEENQADRVRHGTSGKGELAPFSILTDEAVREIVRADDLARDTEFAERFGVKPHTILMVRLRHTWKHVEV